MPNKSRRNRRNIPQSTSENTNQVSSNSQMATQAPNAQPGRATPSKGATSMIPDSPYLVKDLKWTGIVTVIVVVILIVAYFIFR
jgi:hypothetical protein